MDYKIVDTPKKTFVFLLASGHFSVILGTQLWTKEVYFATEHIKVSFSFVSRVSKHKRVWLKPKSHVIGEEGVVLDNKEAEVTWSLNRP
ncbi:MAG: hypothetical protein ACYTFK_08920 [Planctomycetota bacterium]